MQTTTNEDGAILLVMTTMLMPLLLVVGIFSVAMTGKTDELAMELSRERALLACEAGVDDAICRGAADPLALVANPYKRDLGGGLVFSVEPTNLETDGEDNDGDGKIDAADDDENVIQVEVTGYYQNTRRRVAAYLGLVPVLPLPSLVAAIGTLNPAPNIQLQGTPLVSGVNQTMTGSPVGAGNVEGLSVAAPTTAPLLATLTPAELSKVTGATSPSLTTITTVPDLTTLVPQLQNAANIVLTSNMYPNYQFGNGELGTANITYREGDVTFSGTSRGAGVLVVTGDLVLKGTFRFDGLIIVLGDITQAAGTADIYGSLLQGPAGSKIQFKGTVNSYFSASALALADQTAGDTIAYNGWQELTR